jgi:hypothetical protein
MFLDGWVGGWVGGWMGVKAVLRIAYSNQKFVDNNVTQLVNFATWLGIINVASK